MDAITLYLCSKSQAMAVLQQLRSRAVNSDHVRTVIVSETIYLPNSECIDAALFADVLAECRNVQRLDLDHWTFRTLSDAHLRRAEAGSLCHIKELIVGGRGRLTAHALFSLLAAMPALQSLELCCVFDFPELEGQPFPTPSCQLTSLVVIDDRSIDFRHYAHLLCNSHDTLEHVEVHWVFDPEVGPHLAAGLISCRALRDLVLIGNKFDYVDILSSCRMLRCLTLIYAPSDEEISVLQAPLRELRLIHCLWTSDDGVIVEHLPQLRGLLPRLPALGTVRVVSRSVEKDDAYDELRQLCVRQRLRFTTYLAGYDWVM